WFNLINKVNRYLLAYLYSTSLQNPNPKIKLPKFTTNTREYSWKIALCTLGAEWAHKLFNHPDDLEALLDYFNKDINSYHEWNTPIDRVENVMKGYSLLYLVELTGEDKYINAAHHIADSLLSHPRTSGESLPYLSQSNEILVDTLAMICPFLARYSKLFNNSEALNLCLTQLISFIQNNVDKNTRLPYHGYYSDGPKCLGLHGWGRGTGWYMLGLIDTILELPNDHPDLNFLIKTYIATAYSLRIFQRPDGHWNWAIPHERDRFDSSTTSLLGYCLQRGLIHRIIGNMYQITVDRAIQAIVRVTRSDGVLDGSLAECRGLGKYPQNYGPQLWLQGSATAFTALYLSTNIRSQDHLSQR
ncbi:glycoside hydrolase family 88 protein, partial [bacterium]|nr:glycoside hydrolase family 88 protein [bacterium]